MAYVEIRDDTIWANHIEGGKVLKDRIISLAPGEVIELEVDGIVGSLGEDPYRQRRPAATIHQADRQHENDLEELSGAASRTGRSARGADSRRLSGGFERDHVRMEFAGGRRGVS